MLAEMKKLAMCISLSNLYFLEVWVRLIYDRSPLLFFGSYSKADYITVILNVLVMGIILWLVLKLIERYPKLRLGGIIIFGIVTVVVIKSFSHLVLRAGAINVNRLLENIPLSSVPLIANIFLFLFIFSTIFLFFIAIKNRRQIFRNVPSVLLLLFPFALITISQAAWVVIDNTQNSAVTEQPAELPGSGSNKRVLWIIFDDMDQRVTFEERPETVELRELDRFREEAIYATEAYPPHHSTHISIPSLTTGRLATEIKSSTLYDIKLFFMDTEEPVSWSTQSNVFQKAKQMGFRTAAGGWVLPYHKVFYEHLYVNIESIRWKTPIIERMYYQVTGVMPFIDFGMKRSAVDHQNILEETRDIVINSDVHLVFVHFMPPHKPLIYNRDRDDYNYRILTSLWREPEGHFDNLVLVDRTIGKLRKSMESEGLWDKTTVLISSDHWWRDSHKYDGITDYRVPFLLKLAGQKTPVVFDTPFNTTLSHDLILSVLEGDIHTPEDAVDWLEMSHSKIIIPDYE